MKTVDDVRTLNKLVHFRPSCNFYNMNQLASLWEKKIGITLPRVTVTENDLLAAASGLISSNFLLLQKKFLPIILLQSNCSKGNQVLMYFFF